jgi:hypothetical protein
MSMKVSVVCQMGQHLFYRHGLSKTVFPQIIGKIEFRHASLGNFPGQQVWPDPGHPFHGFFPLPFFVFSGRSLHQKQNRSGQWRPDCQT